MLFPDLAYAAGSAPGGGSQSMLPTIVMIASMLAIFYFSAAASAAEAEAGTRADALIDQAGRPRRDHGRASRYRDRPQRDTPSPCGSPTRSSSSSTAPPSAACRRAGREGCLGTFGYVSGWSSPSSRSPSGTSTRRRARSTSDSTCRAAFISCSGSRPTGTSRARPTARPRTSRARSSARGSRVKRVVREGNTRDAGRAGQPAVVERRPDRGGGVRNLRAA